VARTAVSNVGGGMTRLTPTHVTKATFAPGATTLVTLGRVGRQVIGRLSLPSDTTQDNDWRLAMISIQSQPKGLSAPRTPPIPKVIDPVKDRDAAMAWWNEWRHTEEGRKFEESIKQYQEAVRGFQPAHFSSQVATDGSFTFEDMPPGEYQMSVQAFARPEHGVGHGDVIATLQHVFIVPDASSDGAGESINLGDLKLKSFEKKRL
jgi:hypothetical protein